MMTSKVTEQTTALEQIIRQEIDATGPIRLDRFMQLCLTHPDHGYYTNAAAIGGESAKGDFITAPEVSQMFGEMLAVWIVSTWQALGAPTKWQLVEFGPGRGTMMADIMSVVKTQPQMMAGLTLVVVDASADRWKAKLGDYEVEWFDSFADVPDDVPTIFLGNEFFDALPVRQFIRIGETTPEVAEQSDDQVSGAEASFAQHWGETHVYAGDNGLGLCQTITALPTALVEDPKDDLDVVEYCASAGAIVDAIAARLRASGGAALFIDYGYHHLPGQSTLQAVRGHEKVDPLSQPGLSDLTTLVNFGMIRDAARASGCQVGDIANQGDFLRALGIDQRAVDLAQANTERAQEIGQQVHRLTDDSEMGVLFKALSFWHLSPKPTHSEMPDA